MTGLCLASVCQLSHNESGRLVWSHLNQNFIKVAALKKMESFQIAVEGRPVHLGDIYDHKTEKIINSKKNFVPFVLLQSLIISTPTTAVKCIFCLSYHCQ